MRFPHRLAAAALFCGLTLLGACAPKHAGPPAGWPTPDAPARKKAGGPVSQGTASWYGPKYHGRTTANGERFDMEALTAAHRSLPFGTRIRVTNLRNGRELVLRVNDRGPYIDGRILDVSRRAARELGFLKAGLAMVRIEVMKG